MAGRYSGRPGVSVDVMGVSAAGNGIVLIVVAVQDQTLGCAASTGGNCGDLDNM
jgi:hypothetical protein